MNTVMLIDIGSTFTKVCAVNLADEKILATAQAVTTVQEDICIGINNAINNLEKKIGKLTYSKKLACSSAAGGLIVMTSGLVKSLTVKAAHLAALGAGAKVTNTFHHHLTQDDIDIIANNPPDIFLLAGGTDGGNQDIVLHNAKKIAYIKKSFPIVYAGNRVVAQEVQAILKESEKQVFICPNIMPEIDRLNTKPVNDIIRKIFIEQIVKAKGIKKAEELIDDVLMPTPSAVLKATELLSDGTDCETGLGELMVIDVGGATTDIHSISTNIILQEDVIHKGLIEPRILRSVEGDIGLRYSAKALVSIAKNKKCNEFENFSKQKISKLLDNIDNNPSILFQRSNYDFDIALAKSAIYFSVKRHCGTYEKHYTAHGVCYLQQGKDFTNIKTIIGTGGMLTNSTNPKSILKSALYSKDDPFSLRPKNPNFYIDKSYILSAIGLLSVIDKNKALRIMKKNIISI